MSDQYLCPHCMSHLYLCGHIIFSTKSNNGAGLVLLHPELGNYLVTKHPSYKFDEGELLEFFCPVCHYKLASDKNENLAKILLIDENNKEYHIYFSQVAGERSTYKIIGEKAEYFGQDSGRYLDILSMR